MTRKKSLILVSRSVADLSKLPHWDLLAWKYLVQI
jgi:hypothetical protein